MKFSHSRVECFKNCPYQFKLRYIDELETLDDYEASNPLTVGTALHTGIEKDIPTAIKEYYMSYPVITDNHITEAIKLEVMIGKARDVLPLEHAQFEVKLEDIRLKGLLICWLKMMMVLMIFMILSIQITLISIWNHHS